jgi:hypothetical protein
VRVVAPPRQIGGERPDLVVDLPSGLVGEPPAVGIDIDEARGVDVEGKARDVVWVDEREPTGAQRARA